MNPNKFQDYLALYGSDISLWPYMLQEHARRLIMTNASCKQMLTEERWFDNYAMKRPALQDDAHFVERIIHAATHQKPKPTWRRVLQDILATLPITKPAYAFATIALLGVLIGFATQSTSTNATYNLSFNTLFDDTGALL